MTTLAELRLANLREQKKSAEDPIEAAPPPPRRARARPSGRPRPGPILDRRRPSTPPSEAEVEAERNAALIARVRASLAHKVLHPTGAKATVDMSPALFHRSKRYCLDHGNVTLRQLFLDLMTAFLDEEGY